MSNATLREALALWPDAYAAFRGAFDTPQQRLLVADDYSNDARKRLREFDDMLAAAVAEALAAWERQASRAAAPQSVEPVGEVTAAQQEVQHELAGVHRLLNAAQYGDVEVASAIDEASRRLSIVYHGALQTLLAPPSAPTDAEWQEAHMRLVDRHATAAKNYGVAMSERPGSTASERAVIDAARYAVAASPQPAAQPEQPEPGVLTEARLWDLAWASGLDEGGNVRDPAAFGRAIEREVLATTRKRTAEQNARIMEAVKLAIGNKASVHEVERLLGGEA